MQVICNTEDFQITEVMTPESQWSNIDRLYQIRKVYMVEKE